jgi:glyoxylase-like metal-dependent hydrolase (beta-lactamase superfamily II)
MQILDRRNFLALTGAAAATAAFSGHAHAASTTSLFTGDPYGAFVDSFVVIGEKKALAIDAQFTAANATKLADMIVATGRELETLFITHFHPDHHLGTALIKDKFPNVKVLAHKSVQPQIAGAAQAMLDQLTGMFPGTMATKVVLPEALAENSLVLEGEQFPVLDPMAGDTALITAVHLPQFDTVVASDIVYQDTHVWMAEATKPEALAAWRASLDQIEKLGAKTIIPGHRVDTSKNDVSAIAHTRKYLDSWEAAMASSKTKEELKAMMLATAGSLAFDFALDRAIAAVYP